MLTRQDVANKSATSWQQVVVMEFGKQCRTQQTQRTFPAPTQLTSHGLQ